MEKINLVRIGAGGAEQSRGDYIAIRLEKNGVGVIEVRLSGTAKAVMEGNKHIYTQEPFEYIEDIVKEVYYKNKPFSSYITLLITSTDLTLNKENIIETWKHFVV